MSKPSMRAYGRGYYAGRRTLRDDIDALRAQRTILIITALGFFLAAFGQLLMK